MHHPSNVESHSVDPIFPTPASELPDPPSTLESLLQSPRAKVLALVGGTVVAAAAFATAAVLQRRRAGRKSFSGHVAAFAGSKVAGVMGRAAMGLAVAAAGAKLRTVLAGRKQAVADMNAPASPATD